MKLLFTKLLLCISVWVMAQESDLVQQPRKLNEAFTKISVSSGIELFLTQGSEPKLAISVSDSKWEPGFKTEVKNGTLHIYYDTKAQNFKGIKRKLAAFVTYQQLTEIEGNSGSNTQLVNSLQAQQLKISFSSGSMFSGKLEVAQLQAEVSSGAQVKINGNTGGLEVQASSGSMFKANELLSNQCKANAHSGALIKIQVQKEISADAHSGASIQYTGNAQVIKKRQHSGGSIKKV